MESPIPISPGSTTSRRASSIFPQYLRRKTQRKDSTLVSESTTNLWPFMVEEKQPTLYDYQEQDKGTRGVGFKFGWVNGVYVRIVKLLLTPSSTNIVDSDSNCTQYMGRHVIPSVIY